MLVWHKGKSFLFKILGDTTKRKLGWLGEETIMVESCASTYGESQTKGKKSYRKPFREWTHLSELRHWQKKALD